MPIKTVLELSTAHLAPKDWEILDHAQRFGSRSDSTPLIVDPIGQYGWTVNVGVFSDPEIAAEARDNLQQHGMSEQAIDLVLEAYKAYGVETIRIDRDADIEPSLPTCDENGIWHPPSSQRTPAIEQVIPIEVRFYRDEPGPYLVKPMAIGDLISTCQCLPEAYDEEDIEHTINMVAQRLETLRLVSDRRDTMTYRIEFDLDEETLDRENPTPSP